jgi:hypothetical protein
MIESLPVLREGYDPVVRLLATYPRNVNMDRNRSIAFSELEPSFNVPDCLFVSLQSAPQATELVKLPALLRRDGLGHL